MLLAVSIQQKHRVVMIYLAGCCCHARAGGGLELVMGRAAVRGRVRAVWRLLSLNSKSTGFPMLLL